MRLVLRVELCRDTTSFSSCSQGELYSYRLLACWNMCFCVADSKKSCLHVLYICTFLKMKYVPYVPYVTPSQLFVIQFVLSTCFLSFCQESYSIAALLWDLKCDFALGSSHHHLFILILHTMHCRIMCFRWQISRRIWSFVDSVGAAHFLS